MNSASRITSVDEVPPDTTFLLTVREAESGEEREAILVRADGEVDGWLNYCQHLTHISLDKGSGAPMRNGEIVCTNHGAYFESDTGLCTYGPCEGAYLTGIDLTVEDGWIYLTDAAYEFVDVGPIDGDADLTSTSNVEF